MNEVRTFKSKNKRKSLLRDTFIYRLYLFIRGCKFVVIETHAYDIAHDMNALII